MRLNSLLALTTLASVFLLSPLWGQGVIHTFKQQDKGTNPLASLTSDANGNLYGVTLWGGVNAGYCAEGGCGVAFKLSNDGGSSYSYSVMYALDDTGPSTPGAGNPSGPLIVDAAGNFYGTSSAGGIYNTNGTVFEISPVAGGGYTSQILYSFPDVSTDGYAPVGLVLDSAGNLYGATLYGGTYSRGTIYELSPNGSGGWTETTLYSFPGGMNGGLPTPGPLVRDAEGNLYGATQGFGAYGYGVVYKLSPAGDSTWTEQPLYSFNGNLADGGSSPFGLVRDDSGNIYGVATYAQTGFDGLIFELTQSGGVWTEQVLHRFRTTTGEGYNPQSIALDSAGTLYVTTYFGGKYGYGSAIEFTPDGTGGWTEKDLHSFTGGADGAYPTSRLILGVDGELYGTTIFGGSGTGGAGYGVVFTLKP